MTATDQETKTTSNNKATSSTVNQTVAGEREFLEQLLRAYTERLRNLELKAARFGASAPVEVVIEIDELRNKVEHAQKQLKQLDEMEKTGQTKPSYNQSVASDDMFRPEYSVLRSKVQYVDANLALIFADASQDVNIMLGFFTLFLGSGVSFAVSLATSSKPEDTILLWTATAFSFLTAVIFGVLAIRSWIKAESAKKLLFKREELKQVTSKEAP